MPKGKEKVIEQTIARQTYTRRIRVEEKQCPVCGKTFEGVKKSKFCSPACKAKANYKRHAEEYRTARIEKYRQQKQQSTHAKG